MNQPNPNAMSEENIVKLVISYSLPVIIGLFVGAFYNIIDRVFIGKGTGELGIAGIAVSFPLMMGIMACSTLVGMGATSIASIRMGEKNMEGAEKVMGNALSLLILVALVLTVPSLIFLEPLLKAFGASAEILPYAKDYIWIILLAALFMIVGSGMNNFIRAEGNPKKSMLTLLIGSVLNVILAPIFIFGFDWGMEGAALATAIAQLCSATWVMSHFFSGKSVLKIRLRNMKLEGALVGKIFTIGVGSFITQIASSVFYVIINNVLLRHGGNTAISGMGVVSTVQTFVMLPIWGISLGIQPIIGYNYGAKNLQRVKDVLKSAIVFSTVIASVAFVLMCIFSRQIVGIFTTESAELLDFGSHAMLVFLMFTPLLGLQIIGAGYFQAIGKPKQSILLSLTRQVFILIPALLILPLFWQIQGVLVSGPISDFCSSAIVLLCLTANFRQFRQEQSKEPASGLSESAGA